jgi:hypothetical protein
MTASLLAAGTAALSLCLALGAQAAPSPTADAPAPGRTAATVTVTGTCLDLQSRLDEIMVPLAQREQTAATIDVTLHLENGRVTRVDTQGGTPRLQRGVQRALRELDCAPAAGATRRLRVLVVDPWNHLPS